MMGLVWSHEAGRIQDEGGLCLSHTCTRPSLYWPHPSLDVELYCSHTLVSAFHYSQEPQMYGTTTFSWITSHCKHRGSHGGMTSSFCTCTCTVMSVSVSVCRKWGYEDGIMKVRKGKFLSRGSLSLPALSLNDFFPYMLWSNVLQMNMKLIPMNTWLPLREVIRPSSLWDAGGSFNGPKLTFAP